MINLGANYSKAVLFTLALGFCSAANAQTVGQSSVGPTDNNKSAKQATVKAPQQTKVTSRVSAWFAKYDQIRRKAQMPPEEKRNAHKLLTAALTGDPAERAQAQQMLTEMSDRYNKAVSSLSSLPTPPETSSLHQGYLQYFKAGHNFFQHYLVTLKKTKDPDPAIIPQLESAKRQLAYLDVSNKILDKKLRKEYKIAPYHYE